MNKITIYNISKSTNNIFNKEGKILNEFSETSVDLISGEMKLKNIDFLKFDDLIIIIYNY